MNWLQNFWNNKKSRYVMLGLLLIVAIICGGRLLLKSYYTQSIINWRDTVQAAFEKNGKKIREANDSNAIATALDEVQKTLNERQAPIPPMLFGTPLLSDEVSEANIAAKNHVAKISAVITDIKSLLTYQAATIKPLASMSGKSTDNLEQLKKLEGEWHEAAKTIAEIAPPEKARTFHQALSKAIKDATIDLAALIPLFERQDVAGFEVKKQSLNDKINTVQTLGGQFAELTKMQDEELSKRLHELDHSLELMTTR